MMTGATQTEELARKWAKAELDADAGFLDETLADDFVAIGPRGFVLTKEEWIERHTSGKLTYGALELEGLGVRVYGDAAVVTARQVSDVVYRDGEQRFEMHDDLRITVIFATVKGSPSIVGVQLSPIAGPPA